MKGWVIGIIVVIVAVLAVVGIANRKDNKGSTSTTTPTSSSNPTSSTNNSSSSAGQSDATATNSVTVQDMAFSPAKITVKKGTKVTWTNRDSTSHTVTSDNGTTMNSQSLGNGDTYSVTFNTAGTFDYHCNFHSDMHGTVVVTE